MTDPATHYYYVAVETFVPPDAEPSSNHVRVRPLENQSVSTELRVECDAVHLRRNFKVGTVFILKAKLTDRDGTPFIYSYMGWEYVTVERNVAEQLIKEKLVGFYDSAFYKGLHVLEWHGAKCFKQGEPCEFRYEHR